jgi:hypothetical protein
MDFCVSQSLPSAGQSFEKGLFLWIFHLQQTPPHIGVSLDGTYFHLKINEAKYQSVSILLQKIERKQLDVLIIELDSSLAKQNTFNSLGERFPNMSEATYSCLFPILTLLGIEHEYLVLPELLHRLQNEQKLIQSFRTISHQIPARINTYDADLVKAHFQLLSQATS